MLFKECLVATPLSTDLITWSRPQYYSSISLKSSSSSNSNEATAGGMEVFLLNKNVSCVITIIKCTTRIKQQIDSV